MPSRDQYAVWRAHPNAQGPTAMLLHIHDRFREASEYLVQQRDPIAIARVFRSLGQTLHHHHHAEEAMLFPIVEKRTGVAPERLQSDHDELTEVIEAVDASLTARAGIDELAPVVRRFHEVLVAHLDREEELVIPVLLELAPREVWGLLEG